MQHSLAEKLTVPQLVKKLYALLDTSKFIIVVTKFGQLSLS
jgi:hypothetical protein